MEFSSNSTSTHPNTHELKWIHGHPNKPLTYSSIIHIEIITYIPMIYMLCSGYMPPEYVDNGSVSKKYDVFSLGVIIIKVMDGNMGRTRSAEMDAEQFTEHVRKNIYMKNDRLFFP